MAVGAVQISNSIQKALDGLLGFIPNLIGFVVILLVTVIQFRISKALVFYQ